VVLNISSTITISNLAAGEAVTVYIFQGGSGGFAPTWAVSSGSLFWINELPATLQPTVPTTGVGTVTSWRFLNNGTSTTGQLIGSSSFMALGGAGGTNSGSVLIFGKTSGFATLTVPAVAGTPNFALPATNGSNGQALITDGAGNTSWSPSAQGTGLVFNAQEVISSNPPSGRVVANMYASRALTVDKCAGAYNNWSCTTYPIYAIEDTNGTILCSLTTTNSSGAVSPFAPTNTGINSGDSVQLLVYSSGVGCTNGGQVGLSMTYH
jgi:hypothetical protein